MMMEEFLTLTFDALPWVSAVLTIVLYFIPKYEQLESHVKQWISLGLLFVVVAGAALSSYFNVWVVYEFATWQELVRLAVQDLFIAVLTMVGVYQPTKYIAPTLTARLPWMKPKEG
jgi:hypothetical protein